VRAHGWAVQLRLLRLGGRASRGLPRVARTPAEAVDLAEMGPAPGPGRGEPPVEALAEDWTDASTSP
jgi:hypothetical protein